MLASELTASTQSSAGWPAASIARRSPAMSLVTPVAVSLWQARIALIACPVSARSAASVRSSGTPSPHSTSCTSTSKPSRSAMSIHRWLNWPKREASNLSPGESVLVSAASQAPVPEEGKMKAWPFSVLNTFFRSSSTLRDRSGKRDERWSSIATIIARCTRSGTLVGPGTKRKLRPVAPRMIVLPLRLHRPAADSARPEDDSQSRPPAVSPPAGRPSLHRGLGEARRIPLKSAPAQHGRTGDGRDGATHFL